MENIHKCIVLNKRTDFFRGCQVIAIGFLGFNGQKSMENMGFKSEYILHLVNQGCSIKL